MCYSLRSVGEEHVLSWRFADSMCWSAGQTSPAELELFDLLVCWAADWVWIFRMINDLIYRAFIEYSYVSLAGENQSCCFMSKLAMCPCHRFLGLPSFELREQSLRAMTQPKCAKIAKQIRIASFVTKSHQLHEVVRNIAQNELSHTFFSIQFDLSQAVSKCAILLQCYTFWSVWEKGIF